MVSIGINSGVFSSQNTIISVNFGSNCTFVGGNAFEDCVSLFEINNNNIIKNIHSSAFANTKIYSATFNNLISLGANAFRECSNLTYISIPICPEITSGTFYGCSNLSSINIPIFDKFTIGDDAFVNCTNLKTVNIDKNITNITIGNNAFENCTNLKDINFNNFDKIGDCAFQSCKSLNKIILHKCSEIGSSAFKDCENLKKVYIYKTDSICTLGRSAFHISGSSYPTFYIHPDIYGSYINVTSNNTWYKYKDNIIKMVDNNQIIYTTTNNTIIGNINGNINDNKYTNTYENGYGLIKFDENVKVETLNEILFENQTTLKTVDLPESCKNIEDNAFNGCENLSDIKLSDSLEKIGNFAFQNCKSLTSFTIPQSVTTLGEGIFAGCENIEKFEGTFASNLGSTIVYGSTLICVSPNDNNIKLSERGRFYDISKINQNITRLGNSCFCGCKNMIRVNIPSNIKSIGNYAFKDCENLREIHFYGDPPEIMDKDEIFPFPKITAESDSDGSDAAELDFKIFVPENKLIDYCSANGFNGYQKYIYPMPIGANIIYYCSVNTIKIPNIKGAKIENSGIPNGTYYRIPKLVTFKNCSDVTKIIVNENIKTIADRTFSGCKSLEYIYLSDGITRLGTGCFNECESLSSIHIPRGNNLLRCNFGDDIFLGCKNLKKFVSFSENISEDGRCYIDHLTGELKFFAQGNLNDGEINYVIPNNVKKIGRSAFRNSDITSITFNESIKEIDKFAFMGCDSLKTIEWSNIKEISDGAFSGCDELDVISLPKSLTTIGNNAFDNCVKMKLTSSNVYATEIGDYAFYNCAKINSKLNLKNITNINTGTFYGCESLEYVEVNDNVKTICDKAFYNCTSLSTVNINNSSKLESIGASAFRNCRNLSTFDLSNNATKLKTIGEYAFMGCSVYGSDSNSDSGYIYTIPNSLTYNGLGKYCFYGTAIEKLYISIDSSLEIIPNNAFSNCTNLSEVDIQSSKLMSINSYAFSNCTNLSRVDISNSSLESIDSYAFSNCKVLGNANINLPNTINSIGDYAFYNCNISDITLPKHPSLSLGTNCFDAQGVNKITVIIPNELVFPPIFKTANATPFGNPTNTLKSIKIKTPPILYNVYKTDKYWKIYENNIFLYNPNSDSPIVTPM